MDAANTSLTKSGLFLTLALTMLAPASAQAQPAFSFPNGQTITLTSNQGVCIPVNSSSAPTTQITFTTSTAYTVGSNWLQVSGAGTTPATLCFNVSSTLDLPNGQGAATVTLTATSPSGVDTATINVTYAQNGGGGGTGTGVITADQTAMNFDTTTSSISTKQLTLSTTSSTGVPFSIPQSVNWLTFSPNSGTVSAGNPVVINVTANAAGLSASTYQSSISVQYSGGTLSIPVTYFVNSNFGGGGSGTLTVSQPVINWNYTTGGTLPNTVTENISSTGGATAYTAVASSTGNWLLLNGLGQTSVTALINSPLQIVPGTNLTSLGTGTYTGTVTVTDFNNSNNTATITVNLSVNGATNSGTLTIGTTAVNLNSPAGSSTIQQASYSVTSTVSGTLAVTYSGQGITAALASNSIQAGGSTTLTVYGNPAGLGQGTYNGTVIVTQNGGTAQASVPVTFTVGSGSSGGGGTSNGVVAPTALSFAYQTGTALSNVISQNATVVALGAFTATPSVGSGQTNWLTVTPTSGTGPSQINIAVNPQNLPAGTYTGKVTVATSAGTQDVAVTLLVASSTVVFANPATLNLTVDATTKPTTTIFVNSSDNSALPLTASSSATWLTVSTVNGSTPSGLFQVRIDPSGLANGVYVGNIAVSSGASNPTLNIPVVITVTNSSAVGGSLTFSTSNLNFSGQPNGSSSSQNLTVTAPTNTTVSVSTSVNSGGVNWLSISPSGFVGPFTNQTFSVTANPSGLQNGNYTGTVSFTANGVTQNVPVSYIISSTGTGQSITASPTSLNFSAQAGGAAPNSQTFRITTPNTPVNFTLTTTTADGRNWLSASADSTQTAANVTVSVNPTNLAAGTYTGTVTATPTGGGQAANVAVTLTVTGAPTVSVSQNTLNLTYQVGGTAPTGTVSVTGSSASLGFLASASSTGGWLGVSPGSGTTGVAGGAGAVPLTISVNPSGLTTGSYTGTVVVSGTSGASGSSTVNVNLTVTAPLPTIAAVQNAASQAAGAVSPGEIVSIYSSATGPIGPTTPVFLQLDQNGKVATTLGGVQVLFSGIPAPLTYVSSTQINCVVPYEIAGLSSTFAQVKYAGQSSNAFPLNVTTTAPGIFTQNGSGTGPGAILNFNSSTNGPNNPAAKGSTVQVYMTGEGQTAPAGVTGKVNCPVGTVCTLNQLPVPLLQVTALVDNQPASWSFAGAAPNFVSGVMQINVQIPTNARSGQVSIVVSVGPNASQQGVTVSVQ